MRLHWIFASLCLILTCVIGFQYSVFAQGEVGSPITLEIEPLKQIFSSHEGLVVKFKWTAKRPVKLCLAKDLLSQMTVGISRSGVGKLHVQPLVVQDNSALLREPMRAYLLQSGETLTRRANLKRYHFGSGERWVPGEYQVDATFSLCEQTDPSAVRPGLKSDYVYDPGQETPIKVRQSGWFMIMI